MRSDANRFVPNRSEVRRTPVAHMVEGLDDTEILTRREPDVPLEELTTREAVLVEIDRVAAQLIRIRGQIERAKTQTAITGKYADNDWFCRANSALRHRGYRHQVLLRHAKELKLGSATRFETRFVTIAKRLLKEETFKAIFDEAESEEGR